MRPEDDLQAVKEVVADDDDRAAAGGPSLARADGLDTRRRYNTGKHCNYSFGHSFDYIRVCSSKGGDLAPS